MPALPLTSSRPSATHVPIICLYNSIKCLDNTPPHTRNTLKSNIWSGKSPYDCAQVHTGPCRLGFIAYYGIRKLLGSEMCDKKACVVLSADGRDTTISRPWMKPQSYALDFRKLLYDETAQVLGIVRMSVKRVVSRAAGTFLWPAEQHRRSSVRCSVSS